MQLMNICEEKWNCSFYIDLLYNCHKLIFIRPNKNRTYKCWRKFHVHRSWFLLCCQKKEENLFINDSMRSAILWYFPFNLCIRSGNGSIKRTRIFVKYRFKNLSSDNLSVDSIYIELLWFKDSAQSDQDISFTAKLSCKKNYGISERLKKYCQMF